MFYAIFEGLRVSAKLGLIQNLVNDRAALYWSVLIFGRGLYTRLYLTVPCTLVLSLRCFNVYWKYIVRPLSRTLSQYLANRDRPLQEREILRLFQQMVGAVRYLHDNSVLHRSEKPSTLTTKTHVRLGYFKISGRISRAT